jgi:diguanylate cyclase (GGDEF)-like protein
MKATTRRVLAIAAVWCAVSVALGIIELRLGSTVKLSLAMSGIGLGAAVFALTLKPLNVEAGTGGIFIDLSELALIVALFAVPRREALVGSVIGLSLGVGIRQRRSPIKVAYNIPALVCGWIASFVTFDVIGKHHIDNPWAWVSAAIAIMVFNLITLTSVAIALFVTGDRLSSSQAQLVVRRNAIQSIFTAALGISSMLLFVSHREAVLLIVTITVGMVWLVRVNNRQRRTHDAYRATHQLGGRLRDSDGLDGSLQCIANETVSMLNASSAAVITFGANPQVVFAGDEFILPTMGDVVWERTVTNRQPVLLGAGATQRTARSYLRQHGVRDLVAAPLVRDDVAVGLVVATNHRYAADSFRSEDLELLAQVAMMSAVEVRNHDLIEQLRVEADQHLHDAQHDSLTGLPNRLGFTEAVESVLAEIEVASDSTHPRRAALMFMDLNQFKSVNDSLGHHVGDALLVEIAQRLVTLLPTNWIGARLGGDEFAVIGTFVDDVEIDHFVDVLQHSIMQPIRCDGAVLNTSASIGVAVAPENGLTRLSLMRRADVAMYAAKGSGSRRFLRYQPEQENVTARQLELVADLRTALDHRQVEVCFQPRASLVTGAVMGIEALARWNHPISGPIAPDDFVPLAEQAGLIDQLTDLVVSEAVRVSRELADNGMDLEVSVNISARTLRDPQFPHRVFSLLAGDGSERHHSHAVRLKFEITEREIVLDSVTTNDVMRRLRDRGIRFSIDDFGTGYSSLAYLTQLAVDEVKIDKTFTAFVCESAHHRAIVKSVVDIAATIGLTVVAEGVEDQATWDMLSSLGCEEAQGYLLSRPLGVSDLQTWMQERSRSLAAIS